MIEVKVLFASASDPVVALILERFRAIFPEVPLVVVSEFPVSDAEWIPYHIRRTWKENRDLIQARLAGRRVRLAAVILEPRIPHWRLRALGFATAPLYFLAFNETGEHFMLRPRDTFKMLGHVTVAREESGAEPASTRVDDVSRDGVGSRTEEVSPVDAVPQGAGARTEAGPSSPAGAANVRSRIGRGREASPW